MINTSTEMAIGALVAVTHPISCLETGMENISYHESTVLRMEYAAGRLTLELDDVHVAGTPKRMRLEIAGVEALKVDSVPVDEMEMPALDGEVLTLTTCDTSILALIEWSGFKTRSSITHSYEARGNNLQIIEF